MFLVSSYLVLVKVRERIMTDPYHIHPRSKRTEFRPYKPLHKPLYPLAAGTSRARKAETYRGHPAHVPEELPTRYIRLQDTSRYTGEKLRDVRSRKGVGRPPA